MCGMLAMGKFQLDGGSRYSVGFNTSIYCNTGHTKTLGLISLGWVVLVLNTKFDFFGGAV